MEAAENKSREQAAPSGIDWHTLFQPAATKRPGHHLLVSGLHPESEPLWPRCHAGCPVGIKGGSVRRIRDPHARRVYRLVRAGDRASLERSEPQPSNKGAEPAVGGDTEGTESSRASWMGTETRSLTPTRWAGNSDPDGPVPAQHGRLL